MSISHPGFKLRPLAAIGLLTTTVLLAACGGGSDSSTSTNNNIAPAPFKTLDGKQPLVIGHRGLPGLYPEETQPAYEGAADAGADSLEEDLHLTKDCVLVARHNPWLSDNTNIQDVAKTNPTVAARMRTVPGVQVPVKYSLATYGGPATYLSDLTDPKDPKSVLKSLVVDGEDHTKDWSITDFTVAELKAWIGGTTYDARTLRPSNLNGLFPVLTMQEIINIAKARSATSGRTITVYPEAKNPYWNNAQAIANGCGGGSTHPFEDAIVKLINDNGMNSKTAPILVQSFDPASLKYMRSIGLKARVVQLIDGNDVNYKTGEMIYQTNDEYTFVDGRPYSWTLAGDGRYFGDMLTPAGLAEIKTYADGIGPWKPQVMTLTVSPWKDKNADGTAYPGALADVTSAVPNSVIANAHAAGLFVHVYTFRNEAKYLAGVYKGDPVNEYLTFYRAGVDGVFTDFANTGFAARTAYLKELGR
ncbi:glycerophosphoryl diester phosphodiesterase [Andreprevotia lacus DSM 23236]|jgi:glycerophosphoryl diester phosphodiesterase|uniref:glycerophosphodiester phosphodiesterase n=1 Tax=Andreprevotia lacus DSM 23236 TaxID=1121001 RepID=A0A1W1X936_9NEIS|nr:glycerophosphodiester phosphodiesterase family protein [Andreprevotia lacus]SMC20364.1 glycerophosphoryl diester phosphodiesterase [Andreprevotia lacus DSM 23236]